MSAVISRSTSQRGIRASKNLQKSISYVAMVLLSVVFIFPWFYTFTSSFMSASELYLFPPKLIPSRLQWENYSYIFSQVPFTRWLLNSIAVSVLATGGGLLSATLVAYSFSRFRWHGRDAIFAITLSTMMLPAEVTLIPTYLLFRNLGWLNTTKPLWVPSWFGGGAFSIFLLRQFIMALPRDFDEAATIDGAGPLRILISVLLPLMKPALATLGVISLIGAWNDFMGPLIYLTSPDKFTVALGLRYFQVSGGGASTGVPTQHYLMGCCVLAALPIVILFFCAQKYFVQGIVMSGLKA
jgi:multiple sugar transport system permease protein